MLDNEMEDTYSTIYESETDFDNVLAAYDFRVFGPRVQGPHVLELGCGRGTTTKLLAEKFPMLHVVDASKRCIALARSRVPSSVQFFHTYVDAFEPPHQYHAIVMAHVLEHLEQPVATLQRVQAWLAPGGSVHIVVPNAHSLHRRLGVAMGLIPTVETLDKRDLLLGHRRVYQRESLRQDVTAAGLQILHEASIFLKILTNAQLETMNPRLIEGLFTLGREFPDLCANLYCQAAPASSHSSSGIA